MPVPVPDHEAAERQTLDEIRDWYDGMARALIDQQAAVSRTIREGLSVSSRFVA
jgi:hypothetical protein